MPEGKQAMVTGGGGDVPMGEGAVGSTTSPANAVANGDQLQNGKRRGEAGGRTTPNPPRPLKTTKLSEQPSGNAARGGPSAPPPPVQRGLSLDKTASAPQRAPLQVHDAFRCTANCARPAALAAPAGERCCRRVTLLPAQDAAGREAAPVSALAAFMRSSDDAHPIRFAQAFENWVAPSEQWVTSTRWRAR